MSEPPLDELQFHWEKWKSESKAFWGRAILGTALLLLSLSFQFGYVSLAIPGFTLNLSSNPRLFFIAVNILSWFLFIFLCFRFTDLLRHRVPERMEELIHNNTLPNLLHDYFGWGGEKFDLRRSGRLLYLVFPAYALMLGVTLLIATIHVLFWSLGH